MFNFLLNHSPLLYLTQSLWRDEAFSILASEKPLSMIIPKLTFEPPFYYVLLHYWMKIFGNSEIATRSLSLVGFMLATIVVIFWSEKLFPKNWKQWFLPLTFFLNPMLLYYAFEVRTYGWYTFFAILMFYAYFEKKWLLYTCALILGFYNHAYILIVAFTQVIHFIFINRKQISSGKFLISQKFIQSLIITTLAISPWIIKILFDLQKLKNSWYFPVDLKLILSVLGNVFVGFEGPLSQFWPQMTIFSILLLLGFIKMLKPQQHRARNTYFFFLIIVPLTTILSISIFKPLFVNRYVIPVTIAEVFAVVFIIESIKSKLFRSVVIIFYVLFLIFINIFTPPYRAKVAIRETMQEVNLLAGTNDLVYAQSPLVLFETIYYSNDKKKVYLYNPHNSPFPWYVGDAIFSPDMETNTLPESPRKAFLIKENGSYEIVYQLPK